MALLLSCRRHSDVASRSYSLAVVVYIDASLSLFSLAVSFVKS